MKKNAGFTLLEIMLALVVLSLGTAALVVSLPNNRQDMAEEEARRFYHRLLLLNEDAMLNGMDFGIRFETTSDKYKYLLLSGEGWQEYSNRRYSETELEEGLTLSFALGNSSWNGHESMFEQTSLFDEEMFAEFKEEKQQKPPQVFVLSSGEVTPFSLSIMPDNQKSTEDAWRINALENGVIELLAPGEESAEVKQ